MEFFQSLLEIGTSNWVNFLFKLIILLLITAGITWLIFLILVKSFGKKAHLHRDHFLRLQLVWAFIIVFIIFNVYWFFVVKTNGIHMFKWQSIQFYVDIGAQLLLYIALIGLFVYNYLKFKSLFKN